MLEKIKFIEQYKYDLEVTYKDYLKFEMTIRPNLSSVASLTLHDQLSYMRSQLYHVEQRLNSKLTSNYRNKSKQHLLIKARSVIERQSKENSIIHSHSILAIHRDVEDRFLKNFEVREGKHFIQEDLMQRKFYKLKEIECQKLNGFDGYLSYMFKNYKDDADEEGKIDEFFCFPASAIPSYRNAG